MVTYAYTNRNQMLSVTPGGSSALATYTYDATGNTLTKTLGNGTVATSAYDADNRLTNLVHTMGSTTLASFQYGYNSVSDRTYVQHQDGKGDAYSYDAIDQVTGVQYQATNPGTTPTSPMRTVGYGLDSVGNWTGLTDSVNGNTSFTANNLNQYTAVNTTTPTYDGNGNLTGGLGAFVYDAQNRLTSATNGTNTITFSYDPLNRCVSRTDNGTTTFLIYDGWSLIDEQNSAGVAVAKYIGGAKLDEMLTLANSAGTSYYQQDGLGSTALLTSSTGTPVESYIYDVYGTPAIENGSGTVIAGTAYGNRFLFTGREYLPDVNLYDYRNRMYSPQWGRWLSRDPISEKGGINIYCYVGDNPINSEDPLGLSCDWFLSVGHGHVLGTGAPRPNTNNSYFAQHGNANTAYAGCGSNSLNKKGLGCHFPPNNTPAQPDPNFPNQGNDFMWTDDAGAIVQADLAVLIPQAVNACHTSCCRQITITIICQTSPGTEPGGRPASEWHGMSAFCGKTFTIPCGSK